MMVSDPRKLVMRLMLLFFAVSLTFVALSGLAVGSESQAYHGSEQADAPSVN
jgi:hypothetical protein